jgi:hypothetical protein
LEPQAASTAAAIRAASRVLVRRKAEVGIMLIPERCC